MSLKTNIEHIFSENTDYTNPNQAVNQADSLNALSGDLYTDSRRFIYELLQNADDSSQDNTTVKVWIKIFHDNLVVAHSGKPFTPRDLQGICSVNNGTKKSDPTKIGYKGIGFKSVFGQSDHVTIFTDCEYFRFDSFFQFEWKLKWETSKTDWEQINDRKFQFPWQIIPIYTETHEISEPINQFLEKINATVATIIKLKNSKETTQAIDDLSQNVNMFLFLKSISEINFDVSNPITVEIKRKESDRIILKNSVDAETEWLINTVSVKIPAEVKTVLNDERNIPEKLFNADSIELSLAAKVGINGIVRLTSQERLLYSYLPTDETKYSFPVLVNASFLTSANREALHADSKWNQWLFKNIAIEIFKWISKLVKLEFEFQAYQLIPRDTFANDLGEKFNEGIKEALKEVPFVISNDGSLVKVEEAIVDFTLLSEKHFIGEELIKKFIDNYEKTGINSSKKFAKNTGFGSDLKKLGAACFEWKDLPAFLSSSCFTNTHTLANNIQLIKQLKNLCESDKIKDVSKEMLINIPFVWDHRNSIKCPRQVCFPTADDQNWNNPESELSFLHQELQNWLLREPEMRVWLESLGMIEKTDITYITQTILPNINSYVTTENATQTIQDFFNLYRKGDLKEDLLKQLSRIKLLTQKGSLVPANECFLSDFYNPRLEIENELAKDIFVNKSYCKNIHEKDEWKRFFKMMEVSEGISFSMYTQKKSKESLICDGIDVDYLDVYNNCFYNGFFSAYSFSMLGVLSYLQYATNHQLAKKYWEDVINYIEPDEMRELVTAYWGYSNMSGQTSGSKVENYISWFIKNQDCIPVLTNKCVKSEIVILNNKEIIDISGKYLPVFDGIELSPNWKAFFNFKTSLQLTDYFDVLKAVASDINEKGEIKKENTQRIQFIYSALLNKCTNWSSEDISEIEEWANSEYLLNTKKQFTECRTLNFFIDGNDSIFQDQFYFMDLSAENKKHPNIEKLLSYLKVKILRQSDFELDHSQEEECIGLKKHLRTIIPYFKIWINNDTTDDRTREYLNNLEDKIDNIKIYQAEELKIKYADIDFVKNVNLHFDNKSLFVTNPWYSNNVLLKLPEVLCRYFYLLGHDRKLDFLLRSTVEEIQKYFAQEEIIIPEDLQNTASKIGTQSLSVQMSTQSFNSFADFETAYSEGAISSEFFHVSRSEFENLKRVESLISRSVSNIIEHLNKLPEYDCKNYYEIARSIIGGITKNGNDITVVARPSDGDKVLLFYTSEFDVLEYVDAEFWCEDGLNAPKQITLGLLLKQTGINRIPIKNIDISISDLVSLLNNPKSEEFDFDAVPFVPQKIAKIISSFANTNGGTLIFGLKENTSTSNEIVGLSTDFRIIDITKKAISLLSPIPAVTYDWLTSGEKSFFVIKTKKADQDILFENQKYLRKQTNSVLEENASELKTTLNAVSFRKTIAIIITIENYVPRTENQISKVKYANADALKFKKALIEYMNVDEHDIHIYLDDQALKSSLEYDLKSLYYTLTEEDRLIFYYVGHGFHNGVTNYLSTYDMHKFNIAETAVSLSKILLDPLQKSKCKNALIFIDACAQSFQDENERSQISDINDEELVLLTNEFPYYATFLSCQPGQSSYSSDILNNGIWTHHLIKALSGEVTEVIHGNKYITDTLLKDYLSKNVAAYTKEELGYDQNPRAILDSSCENVIVILEEKIKK